MDILTAGATNIGRYGPAAGRTERRLLMESFGAQTTVFLDVQAALAALGKQMTVEVRDAA